MNESPTPAPATVPPKRRGPSVTHLLIVVVILAVTVIVTALTSNVTQALEPGIRLEGGRPFLPQRLGQWQGAELQGLTEDERKLLPSDTEGARRRYRDGAGHEVACSVVLAGTDVTSIHRPELCLPGQGWLIENGTVTSLPAPGAPGGALQVMWMDAKRNVGPNGERNVLMRSVFAYWFIGKDRVTPHHWERMMWTAKDRVLHGRNHRWAYVLVYLPVPTGPHGELTAATQAEAQRTLADFVAAAYPALVQPRG
jgi:EpsI family protein